MNYEGDYPKPQSPGGVELWLACSLTTVENSSYCKKIVIYLIVEWRGVSKYYQKSKGCVVSSCEL